MSPQTRVYLVYEGTYSDRYLLGVYATFVLARRGAETNARPNWQTHVHEWPMETSDEISERRWACEGFDRAEGVWTGLRRFDCTFEIEERTVIAALAEQKGAS